MKASHGICLCIIDKWIFVVIPVSQLPETQYKALLRSGGEKRKEIPETIYRERIEKNWEVNPWHRKTAEAIIHAIEAGA